MIATHLCWGHCRVVLQLPTPPAGTKPLAAVSDGGAAADDAEAFALAMDVCARWGEASVGSAARDVALRDMQPRQCQVRINKMAERLWACPPVGLTQV